LSQVDSCIGRHSHACRTALSHHLTSSPSRDRAPPARSGETVSGPPHTPRSLHSVALLPAERLRAWTAPADASMEAPCTSFRPPRPQPASARLLQAPGYRLPWPDLPAACVRRYSVHFALAPQKFQRAQPSGCPAPVVPHSGSPLQPVPCLVHSVPALAQSPALLPAWARPAHRPTARRCSAPGARKASETEVPVPVPPRQRQHVTP